jgi:hypothetical protein
METRHTDWPITQADDWCGEFRSARDLPPLEYHVGQEVEAYGYLHGRGFEMGWRRGTIIHPFRMIDNQPTKIWWVAFQDSITRIGFHEDNLRPYIGNRT